MWILVLPVAVDEGVLGWKRWLGLGKDQSLGDAVNVLYQQFGPLAIVPAIVVSLAWWLYWYPPKWLRRRVRTRSAICAVNAVGTTQPVPETWIPREEAEGLIKRSSLIRMRVTNDVTVLDVLARRLGDTYRTPGEVRTDELTRKLLRDFEAQQPTGEDDGQYGKELLEWWIEDQAFRTAIGQMEL